MLDQTTVLDRVFAALSDPTRRAILERLGRGHASVSELAEPLDMTLAAVVQHVQVLDDSGLIRTEKIGRVRTCRLDPETLGRAGAWIARQEAFWQTALHEIDHALSQARKKSHSSRKKR